MMFEGKFQNNIAYKAFISPLGDLIKIGINQIQVDIGCDAVHIGATTPDKSSNFVCIDFSPKTFEGFKFPSMPFVFCIYDLSEFIGMLKIIGENVKLHITNEVCTFTCGKSPRF